MHGAGDQPPRPVSGAAVAALLLVAALAGPTWDVMHYASSRSGCVADGTCTAYAWASSGALAVLVAALVAAGALVLASRARGTRGPRRGVLVATCAALAALVAGALAIARLVALDGTLDRCAAPLDAACRSAEAQAQLAGALAVGLLAWGAAMLGLALLLRGRARRAQARGG